MLTYNQAYLVAEAINTLFDSGEPYILVECQQFNGFRPKLVSPKFKRAFVEEHNNHANVNVVDSMGTCSEIEIDEIGFQVLNRQIIIGGASKSGAQCWRLLKSTNDGRFHTWKAYAEAWERTIDANGQAS